MEDSEAPGEMEDVGMEVYLAYINLLSRGKYHTMRPRSKNSSAPPSNRHNHPKEESEVSHIFRSLTNTS